MPLVLVHPSYRADTCSAAPYVRPQPAVCRARHTPSRRHPSTRVVLVDSARHAQAQAQAEAQAAHAQRMLQRQRQLERQQRAQEREQRRRAARERQERLWQIQVQRAQQLEQLREQRRQRALRARLAEANTRAIQWESPWQSSWGCDGAEAAFLDLLQHHLGLGSTPRRSRAREQAASHPPLPHAPITLSAAQDQAPVHDSDTQDQDDSAGTSDGPHGPPSPAESEDHASPGQDPNPGPVHAEDSMSQPGAPAPARTVLYRHPFSAELASDAGSAVDPASISVSLSDGCVHIEGLCPLAGRSAPSSSPAPSPTNPPSRRTRVRDVDDDGQEIMLPGDLSDSGSESSVPSGHAASEPRHAAATAVSVPIPADVPQAALRADLTDAGFVLWAEC